MEEACTIKKSINCHHSGGNKKGKRMVQYKSQNQKIETNKVIMKKSENITSAFSSNIPK